MPAIFSAIMGFFASAIGKSLVDKLVMFIALKTLLTALFVVVAPIILNNVLHSIMETVIAFADTQSSGAGSVNGNMAFVGFGAYLMEAFQVSAMLSILVSAIQLRLALSMIPFINFGR